jgi:hypothetical protein
MQITMMVHPVLGQDEFPQVAQVVQLPYLR